MVHALDWWQLMYSQRERAVVVEDTMLLVKDLQHRKEELLKKRAQLRHTVLTHQGLAPWGSSHCNKNRKVGATTTTTTHGTVCETGSPLSSFMDLMMRPTEIMKSTCPPGSGNYAPNLSNIASCKDTIMTPITCNNYTSCVKTLRIHAGLPDEEIVVDMVCGRPPSNLHSLLIHTVELVCLELTNFSLHRISHELVQCKISGKVGDPSPLTAFFLISRRCFIYKHDVIFLNVMLTSLFLDIATKILAFHILPVKLKCSTTMSSFLIVEWIFYFWKLQKNTKKIWI